MIVIFFLKIILAFTDTVFNFNLYLVIEILILVTLLMIILLTILILLMILICLLMVIFGKVLILRTWSFKWIHLLWITVFHLVTRILSLMINLVDLALIALLNLKCHFLKTIFDLWIALILITKCLAKWMILDFLTIFLHLMILIFIWILALWILKWAWWTFVLRCLIFKLILILIDLTVILVILIVKLLIIVMCLMIILWILMILLWTTNLIWTALACFLTLMIFFLIISLIFLKTTWAFLMTNLIFLLTTFDAVLNFFFKIAILTWMWCFLTTCLICFFIVFLRWITFFWAFLALCWRALTFLVNMIFTEDDETVILLMVITIEEWIEITYEAALVINLLWTLLTFNKSLLKWVIFTFFLMWWIFLWCFFPCFFGPPTFLAFMVLWLLITINFFLPFTILIFSLQNLQAFLTLLLKAAVTFFGMWTLSLILWATLLVAALALTKDILINLWTDLQVFFALANATLAFLTPFFDLMAAFKATLTFFKALWATALFFWTLTCFLQADLIVWTALTILLTIKVVFLLGFLAWALTFEAIFLTIFFWALATCSVFLANLIDFLACTICLWALTMSLELCLALAAFKTLLHFTTLVDWVVMVVVWNVMTEVITG